MTRRVLFYVQHLLGVGHVFRALRVARGLHEAGFAVDLVLGGVPVAGLDVAGFNVIQLLPLKAGPDGFGTLVTAAGEPADGRIKAQRAAELLAVLSQSRPDIVLIEAFPFGRRQMRFELMPLLEAAHGQAPRPRIAASIRDILQENATPGRARETVEVLRAWFDLVVVHGDPRLVTLGATFPLADEIASMISYSGIVAPHPPETGRRSAAAADVVVSAGGGAVGSKLLAAAVAAKPATSLASARWLVLAGPNADAADLDRLRADGESKGVAVERFVPDLAAALAGARLSISQAGYNTVADVLVARCRAVLVPFADGGETEQSRRAALIEERGLGIALAEQDLSVEVLAAAIGRALALPQPAVSLDLDGAARTAAILSSALERRQRHAIRAHLD
ncbi:MAG: glycosyl transferase [Hyphomicrobiaceae bacterium]|nr:glycosyl transferase [Hyphomicrobiaceae bacterium]